MSDTGTFTIVIGFSAAISACEKGVQWEQALTLLHQMCATGTTTYVFIFCAAIAACENEGQ